jgi:hypothetical protein
MNILQLFLIKVYAIQCSRYVNISYGYGPVNLNNGFGSARPIITCCQNEICTSKSFDLLVRVIATKTINTETFILSFMFLHTKYSSKNPDPGRSIDYGSG